MDRFCESVSDLAEPAAGRLRPAARPPWRATSPRRPPCSRPSASAPWSGQATTPAEIPILAPPRSSSCSSTASRRSAICTPPTVSWFGARTQIPSSSIRKASSTRRMLSRSAAATTASAVDRPPLEPPFVAPGPSTSITTIPNGCPYRRCISSSWSSRRRICGGGSPAGWCSTVTSATAPIAVAETDPNASASSRAAVANVSTSPLSSSLSSLLSSSTCMVETSRASSTDRLPVPAPTG